MGKWCLYSRHCPWGNCMEPGFCGIPDERCRLDDETGEMYDLYTSGEITEEEWLLWQKEKFS